jgi:hypothetical protein
MEVQLKILSFFLSKNKLKLVIVDEIKINLLIQAMVRAENCL